MLFILRCCDVLIYLFQNTFDSKLNRLFYLGSAFKQESTIKTKFDSAYYTVKGHLNECDAKVIYINNVQYLIL